MAEPGDSQLSPPTHLDYAAPGARCGKRDMTPDVSLAFALLYIAIVVLTAGIGGEPWPHYLMQLVWPVGAAAAGGFLGVSVWARMRVRNGKALWLTKVTTIAGMILLLLLVVGFFIAGLNVSIERVRRIKCASGLHLLGHSIAIYAQNHSGCLPPSFDPLLAELAPRDFVCDSSQDSPAAGPTTQAIMGQFRKPGHCSYVYLGAGMTTGVSGDTVIAYEPLANHDGYGLNVLYADGHVQWLSRAEAQHVLT